LSIYALPLHDALPIWLGLSRPKAIAICVVIVAIMCSACAMSGSVLAYFRLFGRNMFNLMDFVSANLLLPLGGIFIALFAGWVWGREALTQAVSNNGQMGNARLAGVLVVLLRYVSPLLILVVMLHGLGFI